jgi:hypothetical protein
MKVMTFPGCWYTDAIPSGEWVSSHFTTGDLFTQNGSIRAPAKPRILQWVRMSMDRVRFAGTGQDDDHAWEWDGLRWNDAGAFQAPRAVIYDSLGQLHVVREATWPGTGSQGWRYVDADGTLVPAWVTYASVSQRLWEYTIHGDLTIGQGEGGVHALVAGRRVRIDHLVPGLGDAPQTLAVNFWRWGNDCAISFYVVHGPTNFTGVAIWLTRQEFDALPTFDIGAPVPPVSVPQPPTPPEPPVPDINHRDLVEQVRNELFPDKVGKPLRQQHEEPDHDSALLITATVAHRLNPTGDRNGIGLIRAKPGSANHAGDGISGVSEGFVTDAVALPDGTHWDTLGDGGMASTADWRLVPADRDAPGDNVNNNAVKPRWFPPFDPVLLVGGTPTEPGEPGTPPPPASGKGFAAEAALLEATLKAALKTIDILQESIEVLEVKVFRLEQAPSGGTFPTRFALKTAHGKYVAFEPDGRVVADRDSVGEWEIVTGEPQ